MREQDPLRSANDHGRIAGSRENDPLFLVQPRAYIILYFLRGLYVIYLFTG